MNRAPTERLCPKPCLVCLTCWRRGAMNRALLPKRKNLNHTLVKKAEGRKQKAAIAGRYCLLPTAYCLLPTAYCLLPTAY